MPYAKWVGFVRSNVLPAVVLVLVIAVSIWLIHWITPDQSEPVTMIDGPLIVAPPVVSSDQAKLADDCQVIGVTQNGKSRAYVVSAFFRSHQHVINDFIGGKPFAITYCDRNNCTRVFTRRDSPLPLNVTVGGWVGSDVFGTLLLRVGTKLYRQDSAQELSGNDMMPFETVAFERTTWKQWRTKHPNSDVYMSFPLDRLRSVPNG